MAGRSAEQELARMKRVIDNGISMYDSSRRGAENRQRLEVEYGVERVAEARDFNEKQGITRSWAALERTILNWDLIQVKIANGTWKK